MMPNLNIRPFQLIVISVFGVLALVGVFVFATYERNATGSTSAGKVVIWGIIPEREMQGAMEELTRNSDYRNVSYLYVRPEAFASELANALAEGNGPDLVLISQEELASQESKLSLISFKSVPERTYRDMYATIFEIFLTNEGTYGFPLALDPMVMYYNRQTLANAGIATPPTTWAGIRGLVDTLTSRQGDTVAKSAIPFGSYGNVDNARGIISTLFLQAGSRLSERGTSGIRATFTSDAGGGSPVQSALLFYAEFADPVKPFYTWNSARESSRQAFLSGTLAFYPGYASEARSLAAANPNLDFDMARMPQPEAGGTKAVYAKAYALAITKVSRNYHGAFSAALGLTEARIMSLAAQSAGLAPAMRTLIAKPPADLYSPVFYPDALIARGWLSPAPSVTDGIFAGMMQNVTSGRFTIAQAIKYASDSIDASLR
ncbi:MAG: extracellular solute-binding protein [Candidatus Pacebacteria bacterium]|nr:extracellular solute-binding protein [Candidatus Paceibacterota bacterium]MBP9840409.1 extracellular solute-binding protein [Candidatus Paceibacterota bacterium]